MSPLILRTQKFINLVWVCQREGNCNDSVKQSLSFGKQQKWLVLPREEVDDHNRGGFCLQEKRLLFAIEETVACKIGGWWLQDKGCYLQEIRLVLAREKAVACKIRGWWLQDKGCCLQEKILVLAREDTGDCKRRH